MSDSGGIGTLTLVSLSSPSSASSPNVGVASNGGETTPTVARTMGEIIIVDCESESEDKELKTTLTARSRTW